MDGMGLQGFIHPKGGDSCISEPSTIKTDSEN